MFDSFTNLIFIVVVLVIFIGRNILQARKRNRLSTEAQDHDDDEDEEEEDYEDEHAYFKGKAPVQNLQPQPGFAPPLVKTAFPAAMPPAGTISRTSAPERPGVSGTASAGQKSFPQNLNYLSPMKQAVVMAEVLGPPKGML